MIRLSKVHFYTKSWPPTTLKSSTLLIRHCQLETCTWSYLYYRLDAIRTTKIYLARLGIWSFLLQLMSKGGKIGMPTYFTSQGQFLFTPRALHIANKCTQAVYNWCKRFIRITKNMKEWREFEKSDINYGSTQYFYEHVSFNLKTVNLLPCIGFGFLHPNNKE